MDVIIIILLCILVFQVGYIIYFMHKITQPLAVKVRDDREINKFIDELLDTPTPISSVPGNECRVNYIFAINPDKQGE